MSEAIMRNDAEQLNFIVDDDQKAEWCLKKIKEAKADKDFWKRFYEERLRTVEESADATISQMESMLMAYFQTVPHKKTDCQESYPLPSGKLVCKKQEPTFDRKESEVIAWLKKNGAEKFVKVKEELDWSGLKKTVTVVGDGVATSEGEIVPGIKVIPREDVFKVEVK